MQNAEIVPMRKPMTNLSRIESLLEDAPGDTSLEDLKRELNELAKLRHNSRLAFCKRLALAYMLVVGHPLSKASPKDGGTRKFLAWCAKNIRSANGKQYSGNTVRTYLMTGFAANPEKRYADSLKLQRRIDRRDEKDRKFGHRMLAAAAVPDAPRPASISVLKTRHGMSGDVASEVNVLMTAWEAASPEARKQFLHLVSQ